MEMNGLDGHGGALRRSAAVALALVAAVALLAMPAAAGGAGAGLFGKRHLSIRVVKDGAPHQLVEGTRVRLSFHHEATRDVVRWSAGCNLFGARVNVAPKRLRIGQVTSTDVGCRPALARQDRWIARFFGSDPWWAKRGARLRLKSGDDRIVFRARSR